MMIMVMIRIRMLIIMIFIKLILRIEGFHTLVQGRSKQHQHGSDRVQLGQGTFCRICHDQIETIIHFLFLHCVAKRNLIGKAIIRTSPKSGKPDHHHNHCHDHTIGHSRVQKAASLISRGQDPCQSGWFQWHQGKFDFEITERMMIRELVDHKRKKDKDKEKVNSNLVEHIGHHVAQEGKKKYVLGHG